jgi:hypothetical protein
LQSTRAGGGLIQVLAPKLAEAMDKEKLLDALEKLSEDEIDSFFAAVLADRQFKGETYLMLALVLTISLLSILASPYCARFFPVGSIIRMVSLLLPWAFSFFIFSRIGQIQLWLFDRAQYRQAKLRKIVP